MHSWWWAGLNLIPFILRRTPLSAATHSLPWPPPLSLVLPSLSHCQSVMNPPQSGPCWKVGKSLSRHPSPSLYLSQFFQFLHFQKNSTQMWFLKMWPGIPEIRIHDGRMLPFPYIFCHLSGNMDLWTISSGLKCPVLKTVIMCYQHVSNYSFEEPPLPDKLQCENTLIKVDVNTEKPILKGFEFKYLANEWLQISSDSQKSLLMAQSGFDLCACTAFV